jgi:hypothetical protein
MLLLVSPFKILTQRYYLDIFHEARTTQLALEGDGHDGVLIVIRK